MVTTTSVKSYSSEHVLTNIMAAFHNMYSCLPLDWRGKEQTTFEKQRPSLIKNEEKERMKMMYEMSVEARLN